MSRRKHSGRSLIVVGLVGVIIILSVGVVLSAVSSGEPLGAALAAGLGVLLMLGIPVFLAAFTAYVAARAGAPGGTWLWALLGLFFPIVSLFIALFLGAATSRQETAQITPLSQAPEALLDRPATRRCEYCGSVIDPSAARCPNCAAPQ